MPSQKAYKAIFDTQTQTQQPIDVGINVKEELAKDHPPDVDEEIAAMEAVLNAVKHLNRNQQHRIFEWAVDRFLTNDVVWATIEYKEK